MALYIFENMTADEAANFNGATDQLVFSNRAATALNLQVNYAGGLNYLDLTSIDGTSLRFNATQIGLAQAAGHVSFADASGATIVTGTTTGDTLDFDVGVDASTKGVFYGFAGDDVITTNDGDSWVFGGNGGDTIVGGDGNDHLYGFGLIGDPSNDGNDDISGGGGNDYIQGNAGDDTLDGGLGRDRIQGGNGKDLITGGEGNDTINGNKGNDTISGNEGNDFIRGGQGDDLISGNEDNDVLMGDLGDDTLVGGEGIDFLTGGAGNDVFRFAGTDALFDNSGATFENDVVFDFTIGEDKIDLAGPLGATAADIIRAQAGISVSSVDAGLTYAQQLLDNAVVGTPGLADTGVVVLQVGADTYLFYDHDGVDGVLDSAIRLLNVNAADFTVDSII